MQQQANKDILPVKALEPPRRLLRLPLVCVHFTDYQLHRVLGQQVSPASQVSVKRAGAIAAVCVRRQGSLYIEVCMLPLSRLQLGCKLFHARSLVGHRLCGSDASWCICFVQSYHLAQQCSWLLVHLWQDCIRLVVHNATCLCFQGTTESGISW